MSCIGGNRKPGGPSGPPAFSGSSRPVFGLDWSGGLVDQPAELPSAPDPSPRTTNPYDDAKIDAEFDRFFACAIPTPNGLGLYDPSESLDMPSGIPGAAWDAFIRDCGPPGPKSGGVSA